MNRPDPSRERVKAVRKKLRGASRRPARQRIETVFRTIAVSAAVASVLLLAVLLTRIAVQGFGALNWHFIRGVPDPDPTKAGLWPALAGTLLTCTICALSAIPIGVGTAILLEEFRPHGWWPRRMLGFVQLNITNLAGVPSIVYGLLGLTVFANMFGLLGSPSQPAAELGVRHYDQFATAGGRTLDVPVAAVGAPPTVLSPLLRFQDPDGKAVTATITASAGQSQRAIEAGLESVARAAAEAFAKDLAGIPTAIDAAWTSAALAGDANAARNAILPRLGELRGKSGRAARKAVEAMLEPVLAAQLDATLANTIDAAAVPIRVTRGRDNPWYLRLPFGRSVLAGGLTLMLVVLPVIIIASQEALRAVPRSLRMASLAMGATTWQTIWRVTLPSSVPGIMTGVILAMSRAIGEAAPLLVLAGIVYITFTPHNLMDDFTAAPLQIYNWASRPQEEFRALAAGGILLLLGVLLCFNGVAVYIRQRTQRS